MTTAGEFWFKSSEDILGRMTVAMNEREKRFRHSSVVLRLGATPVLRGTFTAATAHIAQSAPGFVKFELVYDVSSSALVEQLRMHQINFAIVSEPAILKEQLSFAVSRPFEDQMAWAVPASLSEDDLRLALNAPPDGKGVNPILTNYIEIEASVPTRAAPRRTSGTARFCPLPRRPSRRRPLPRPSRWWPGALAPATSRFPCCRTLARRFCNGCGFTGFRG